MKLPYYTLFVLLFCTLNIFSQQTLITGNITDNVSYKPIVGATIKIEGTAIFTKTNARGEFSFNSNIPLGEQILTIKKQGYLNKRYPVIVYQGKTIRLTNISLELDSNNESEAFTIVLSEDELNSDDNQFTDNVSGLLQASKDIFISAAAFDFSSTFFRPRGLDNSNGKLLINGIEMNKQFNGRPQWSNWGGINDVLKNQEFSIGFSANDYSFGDIAGVTNIILRASKYKKGGRFSTASANRSYQGRLMLSYNSGRLKKGWAYSILGSRRFGNQGFIEGTLYDANSFFVSVEKEINKQHSLNVVGIYAKNLRGRSTAITQEVANLKGRTYNPLWGQQEGEARNSRVRHIEEPIVMLNHFWELSPKTAIQTSVAYQFGKIGNTRVDNGGTQLFTDQNGSEAFLGGARNPDPSFFQNLPSFFLRNPNPTADDFRNAFVAQEDFIANGQFDFEALFRANSIQTSAGNNATFIIQEDRIDDKQLSINSIINSSLSESVTLNAAINYRNLNSENFANVKDLLGGTGFLDIDSFFDSNANTNAGDIAQSDLRNRNRVVTVGDRYKYNYEINAKRISSFAQMQFSYNKLNFSISANASQTSYQRNGLFENGNFPGTASFGKGPKLNFTNYGLKANTTYTITGRNAISINTGYFTKAPNIRNSFPNARQNNTVVSNLKSETVQTIDLSYIYNAPIVKARLTGYYTGFRNGTEVSFFFTEDLAGLGNEGDAFVQEVLTNIERQNIGMELGIGAQISPTVKLKAAIAVGQNTFANNPNLYLTSDDFNGELRFGNGKTNLKNLHVAGGPEQAFQLGFEYRAPSFWTIGLTSNYFSNAYIDPSALARSENFTLDFDGLAFSQFDSNTARQLLKQEQIDPYTLINITGGKSWRVGAYYIGFFATINNVLNQNYKTGGFEQSRIAKFNRLKEDQSRVHGPLFGNRFFFGNGTTYYANLYLRF